MYIFVSANYICLRYLSKWVKKIKKKNDALSISRIRSLGDFSASRSYVSTGWAGRFCDGGHGCFGLIDAPCGWGHRNGRSARRSNYKALRECIFPAGCEVVPLRTSVSSFMRIRGRFRRRRGRWLVPRPWRGCCGRSRSVRQGRGG